MNVKVSLAMVCSRFVWYVPAPPLPEMKEVILGAGVAGSVMPVAWNPIPTANTPPLGAPAIRTPSEDSVQVAVTAAILLPQHHIGADIVCEAVHRGAPER